MKTQNTKNIVDRIRERVRPENRIFVSKNIEISNQISQILEEKGWTQKEFARKMDKNESEICKWMSGLHNLTLKSICLMEAVLEEDLITTPLSASRKYSRFITIGTTNRLDIPKITEESFQKITYTKNSNEKVA